MTTANASLLAHKGVQWICGGFTFFIAENLVLSENREVLIGYAGERNYHFVYSGLSSAACASIGYGYFWHSRRQGPRIYAGAAPLPARIAGFSLQAIGLVGAMQLLPKLKSPDTLLSEWSGDRLGKAVKGAGCPIDFNAGKYGVEGSATGNRRVTRHPQLFSLGFMSLGAALRTPYCAEAVFFTWPIIFALVGGAHKDHRFRAGQGGTLTPDEESQTSLLPFAALLEGRQDWNALREELYPTNAACGVILALAVLLLRRPL